MSKSPRRDFEFLPASPSDLEQLAALREATVNLVIPYEALLVDPESRKWIAPEVWTAIQQGVAALREALNPELAQRKEGENS